jgi:phenylacetate-CoA ligase
MTLLGNARAQVRDVINWTESGIIRNLVYPMWTMQDHPHYLNARTHFEKNQYVSPDALRELQETMLQRIVRHAARHVPYYRSTFETLGVSPMDIRTADDLRRLPVLQKRDLQVSGEHLLADNIEPDKRSLNRTGGSTGSPIQFWVDKARFDLRRASTDRHNAWAGLRPGDYCALLWGAVIDVPAQQVLSVSWKQRALHRQIMLNTAQTDDDGLHAFIQLVRKYRPRHMVAYAQSAYMFAEFCATNAIQDIHFETIITTAEMLLDTQREKIEATFGGKVFNRYGCREVSVIASECSEHNGLHVNADALIVEIDRRREDPEGCGRILITDLYNLSMPLIRYEIGDLGSWAADSICACGRTFPRLRRIEGRITEFLSFPCGKRVSGPSLTLVHSDMREVRQLQYVQTSERDVTLNVVTGTGFGDGTVNEIRRRLVPYFPTSARLAVKVVDHIPREASGKYRFVKQAPHLSRAGTSA